MDNAVIAEDDESQPAAGSSETNGKIMIGRLLTETNNLQSYGKVTVDHLTIWDRPLSAEERNLIHQD